MIKKHVILTLLILACKNIWAEMMTVEIWLECVKANGKQNPLIMMVEE